ncbi:pentatricopeptide repeat-containing protein At3g62890-like [Syzygium oleosum]|uniref:pentatricopeptide repeat-containing protein At3g62890-like n=1 Tax=Syzygium oleosum TaxID=219896 RepID=UPI0024B9ABDE|nr:pentatricopeptide repeat-containing protein At3g62890-like [Syzygium oleosum]XP_056175089.1 pentatricopeptide repeat-containing protein At3g62890-like [Syzygium oleosum]XP_056175091.1 pentatricopeptide repeat-containing protein At3g62890-like [Syzygium oleosum]XP_056175092.1 pentatricopeptide repeat-containing protein At3g62890-like [Syzygium oleosum]
MKRPLSLIPRTSRALPLRRPAAATAVARTRGSPARAYRSASAPPETRSRAPGCESALPAEPPAARARASPAPSWHVVQASLMSLVEGRVRSDWWGSSSPLFLQFGESVGSELCRHLIRRCTGQGKHLHSVFVFIQMQRVGARPDSFTFAPVLKSVARLCLREMGRSVHAYAAKANLDGDVYVGTSLVNFYSGCSLIGDARKVFDEMGERNSVSWNALITGHAHNRKFAEALDLFREMQADGVEPTEVTMVGVLSACAHLGALGLGKWVHEYIDCHGLKLNEFLGTALVDMYAKCGAVTEMEKVFMATRVKNVYTWNALISGFAMNGRGEAALQAFSRMVMENLKPDGVTFLGILCACCHEGLVDEGKRYFRIMKEEFGLRPGLEHYGCMVDLLGQTGLFSEALHLIQNMDLKPDPIIWRTLLGACRTHRNVPLGRYAARKLLELEPTNADNYVLLSNIYAQDSMWDEIAQLRAMMNQKAIPKVAGCSSIEIGNAIYEFIASDCLKPEVRDLLDDIRKELKQVGYAANTGLALYDIEEEEKESSVAFHSEKIALAFGLMKSPPRSTLRIVKNLRVCQDCHVFFKLVSLVYKREISLRDRNQFHHFAGGSCSCRDHW